MLKFKVVREDPAEVFSPSKLATCGLASIFCANTYMPDDTPEGKIVHILRDTAYGCEMRSHFWFYNDTEENAQIRLEHYISEHGYLADSLKKLIEGLQKSKRGTVVYCKFCKSSEVIKNGSRRNTQYWLCKNCGRGFVDNGSLPKMKYPSEVVGRAVYDHCAGRSIKDIRLKIEKEYNLFPSNSTVSGWIKKLTKTALEDNKILVNSNSAKQR